MQQTAKQLKLLALDVDGVLTDGRIYYDSAGGEFKAFNIKDGLGIKLLQRDGVEVAIITGRESPMVTRRATELGITAIIQGREDKLSALESLCADKNITLAKCAYMGDDLPDLAAIRAAGLGLTVSDAANPVREAADWVASLAGGTGAVREACEMILALRESLQTVTGEFN